MEKETSELQDYRSLFESDNESTAESSSSDSQDEENGNDKWDLNDTIRESFAPTSSVVTNRCTNCGNNMHQQQTFCEKCGNTSKVVNVGEINTTSESKFVSHETIFGTDFRGTNIGSRTVSKIALAEIRCRNCEHIVNQDQIFCDKCGYQLKMECVGKTNGKPCAKLISSASKFCADCGTANLENKQVSTSTSVRNGCRSCGHDIHQDQMFCENCGYKLKTVCIGTNNGKPCSKSISIESQFCENCEIENYSVTKKSPMKRCKRCGQDKYETQKFCDNCGYEIGGVCLGKINGNPCTKSINSVTRFCSDCGTTNPDYNIVYNKNHSIRAGEETYSVPSDHEVSIMRLVSMGFSREQAIESLQSTGGDVEKAIEKILSLDDYDNNVLRKKPPISAAHFKSDIKDESVRTLTSMGYTRKQAIGSLSRSGGNVEKAIDKILRLPGSDDNKLRKKPLSSTAQFLSDMTVEKSSIPSYDSVRKLTSMGYTRKQAVDSLRSSGGNVEKAIEWLLSLPDYDDNLLENPSPTTAQFQSDMKVKKSSLPSYDSVMKMGYTRNQAEDSLRIYGGKVERVERPPSSTVMHDVSTRKKRTVAEAQFQTQRKNQPSFIFSNESVIEIMSLGFTREQAIDALTFSDGNEEEAVIRLVSHPFHNDVKVKKKVEFFEEAEEITDSDFVEIQDSDEENPDSDEEIKDLDEAVIDYFSAPKTHLLPDEQDETLLESEIRKSMENDILHRLKTDGVIATTKFLMVQATKWKRAKVKIAVAGQSSSGKSSFINVIRGVGYKDKGYAQEGYGDTTLEVESYVHPKYKHILYCDLPGYGTTTITREKFLEKVNISKYDIFIIFFTSVPTTDDEWLVRQLQEAKKPFCFVRTKLDQDIDSGKRRGKNEKTVLDDIMYTIARAKESMPALKGADIFIISNNKPYIGDMSKLVKFMQQRVTTVKFEAILFSIPAFTEEIIEKKYKDLLGRITNVAYLHAMHYSYLYASLKENNYDDNIRAEITTYFKVFELDSVGVKDVPNLKHYYSDEHILKLLKIFKEEMPGFGLRLVPIYSVIKKYRVCKQYLTNLLNELKADAYTMYKEIFKHRN